MLKIVVSLLLTLFLGPGAGHIYLRRFKQGLLLFGGTIVFAIIIAWQIGKDVGLAVLSQQPSALIFQEFSRNHPRTVFYYDMVFAALWAYAFVDAFKNARRMMPAPPDSPRENPDE